MHIYHFEYVDLVKGQMAQLEVGNNLNMVLDKGSQYVAILLVATDLLTPTASNLPKGMDIITSISFTATGNPHTYSLPYVEEGGDYCIVVISKDDFDRLVSGIQKAEAAALLTQAQPVDVGAYLAKSAKALINPDYKQLNLELAKTNKALESANEALVETIRKLQADSDLAHIRLRREEGFHLLARIRLQKLERKLSSAKAKIAVFKERELQETLANEYEDLDLERDVDFY